MHKQHSLYNTEGRPAGSMTKRAVSLLIQHREPSVVKKDGKIEISCTVEEAVDPRVRRTRKLLQEALRSLILEKRFSAISVQDITERATVNRATFYAHYVDKVALAISIFQADLHTTLIQRFPDPPALTPESLVEFAVAVFEFMGAHDACPENAAELQDVMGTAIQEELYSMIEGWLSASPAYKRLFPGCTKETVATVLSWSIYGGAYRWSRSERRGSALQACQEIVSILLPQSLDRNGANPPVLK
jgi:AcrR family transcriptional regulator